MKLKYLVETITAALLLSTSAQAAVIFSDSFDSYAVADDLSTGSNPPYTKNFAFVNNSIWGLGTGAGLGGSQSLQPILNDPRLTLIAPAIDLSAGSVDVSIFFKRLNGNDVALPQLGLTSESTNFVGNNPEISLRLNGASPVWQARSDGTTVTTGPALSLIEGNWYQLNASFTRVDASTFTLVGSVFNSDANGNLGSLVSQFSPANITNSLASDSTLYAGMRANQAGVSNLDNFVVSQVPEPSTYALLSALALFTLTVLRRRNHTNG
ncbi:MAG: PEP-CTERM sorting domain-containing protein [Verrucomicrobiota bacterium]|nr:PEP-CTERM sorting domain-containing protein [Verrucomicrobiota bacterium]